MQVAEVGPRICPFIISMPLQGARGSLRCCPVVPRMQLSRWDRGSPTLTSVLRMFVQGPVIRSAATVVRLCCALL